MDFETFKRKYEKTPVKEVENQVSQTPLVSVCIQTYQHEEYIRRCLDGVLMQQTSFQYEILLGEDQSNDSTRKICLEYANKHPELIRLFFHDRRNNIRIGHQATGRFNFLYNIYSSRGRYIACCEGDDYWTDSSKLQKQFDLLEANPSYSASFHDVTVNRNTLRDNSHILFFNPDFDMNKKLVDLIDFIGSKWLVPFCSIFYRRAAFTIDEYMCKFHNGDFPMFLSLLNWGNFHFMNETMATYTSDNRNSLTNQRNVIHRIEYELEKLSLIHANLSEFGWDDSSNKRLSEALKNRSNRIITLSQVLKNSRVMNLYLALYKRLGFIFNRI